MLAIQNNQGRAFNVRLVRVGDCYGRDDCLTHEASEPMVEFYDATQDAAKFGARGQFVARYCFSTIADVVRANRGINLCGHVSAWTVDADGVRAAFTWAAEVAATGIVTIRDET